MKIIDHKEPKTISITEITNNHIIIVKRNEDWCILIDKDYKTGRYIAYSLNINFTKGNSYEEKLLLEEHLLHPDVTEKYAFDNMKDACKFLITVL